MPSPADLTFASLAAPLLFPAACAAALPPLERVPPAMRAHVARFRATAAGEFALTLYERERSITVARPSSELERATRPLRALGFPAPVVPAKRGGA